jgi:hypothetical protein
MRIRPAFLLVAIPVLAQGTVTGTYQRGAGGQ